MNLHGLNQTTVCSAVLTSCLTLAARCTISIIARLSKTDAMQAEDPRTVCNMQTAVSCSRTAADPKTCSIQCAGFEAYLEVCNRLLVLSNLYLDHRCLIRLKDLLPALRQHKCDVTWMTPRLR